MLPKLTKEIKPYCCGAHTPKHRVFYLTKMINLSDALKEFKTTNPILKPRLCLNENTGMYLVTYGFSAQYCTTQNLKVIL